jgi:hypothetical protein
MVCLTQVESNLPNYLYINPVLRLYVTIVRFPSNKTRQNAEYHTMIELNLRLYIQVMPDSLPTIPERQHRSLCESHRPIQR